MLMLRRNRKALSPVIASIILIAVTVAVAVVVASWMGGMSLGLMGNAEQVTITNLDFSTPDHIIATVHNTGGNDVIINKAYVDDVEIITSLPALPTSVAKSASKNIDLSAAWASGIQYAIKMTTSKGNNILFIGKANPTAVDPTSSTPTPTPTSQVTFVSAGTGSGTTGTPTPGYPSGMQSGDLILLQVTVRDTSTTTTTPTGFTTLYSADSTGTGRQWIYYKFATGSESGSLTVSIGGSVTKMARMYAFSNVALSSFSEGGSFGSGTGNTINAPSVTTIGVNRLTVSFVFVNDNNNVGSFAGESGGNWIEAVNEYTTTVGSDGCMQLQIATMATAGTITGGSDTMYIGDPWGVRAFALIPR